MTADSASGGNIWIPRKKASVAITEFKFENKMWVVIAAITVTIASVLLTVILTRGSYFSSPVLEITDATLTATFQKDSIVDQALIIGSVSMLLLTALSLAFAFNPKQINLVVTMVGTMFLGLTIFAVVMIDPIPGKMKNSIDVQAWLSDTVSVAEMPEMSFKDGEQIVFLSGDSQITKVTTKIDGDRIILTKVIEETATVTTK